MKRKNSNNGGKSAFYLTHDSADSPKNQTIPQKTDKLESDCNGVVESSLNTHKYCYLMLNIHKPLDPMCIIML
jgi:hypothetical protein